MQTVRRSDDRGIAQFGWLDSRHTFSFGHYHDPKFMGFGPLRVINEDRVQPGRGFDTHGHRDMEIISYVVSGALRHEDSLGNGSIIRPGDVQRMTAGSGVRHSEHNASDEEPVHFLQIWLQPEALGLPPGYEQKAFPAEEQTNRLALVVARGGRDGAVSIHRDVDIYAGRLDAGVTIGHTFRAGRSGWMQVVSGELRANDLVLQAGDGLALGQVPSLELKAIGASELLLFDMA